MVARKVVSMTVVEDADSSADRQFLETMKRVRRERKWSQADLASELKKRGWAVRQAIVSKIELGERNVRLGEAYLIAQVLGLSVEAMASPGDVHLLLRDLDDDAEHVRSQCAAIRISMETLARHRDRLSSDIERAQTYLVDEGTTPHREAIQRAIDVAQEALDGAGTLKE